MYRQDQGAGRADAASGQCRVDYYKELLNERWRQLKADKEYYERKLQDSVEIDPEDSSGLRRIFQAHINHIAGLMDAIENSR